MIRQNGGIFGRNPKFANITADAAFVDYIGRQDPTSAAVMNWPLCTLGDLTADNLSQMQILIDGPNNQIVMGDVNAQYNGTYFAIRDFDNSIDFSASNVTCSGQFNVYGALLTNGGQFQVERKSIPSNSLTQQSLILVSSTQTALRLSVIARNPTGGRYQFTELIATRNATTGVTLATISDINNGGAAATYGVDISSGNWRLLMTQTVTGTTTYVVCVASMR